ncbi:hypothetical protein ACFTS5_11910 [Nocardia sp. NPDC056952]|uniref:hypothetical protein n=1 Tax=Nocardia sp. NPDC056952 TaxID=3345979 RepID=UPI003641CCC9
MTVSSTTGSVSIPAAIAALPGPFQQHELATVNDTVVRVARLAGEFPWHHHDEANSSSAGTARSASNWQTAHR